MRAASEGKGKSAESRIGFRVLEVSSSDDGFEASALEHAHPQSQGWQSARFCDYPVSLVLELERSSELRQLQILSHESKIATRIELFVGDNSADLHRLGFLSLDANERSQYRARELKSVYIRTKARYIQLLLHRNHANPSNLFSQVGLVAINVLGTRSDPAGPSDLAIDMSLDPRTAVLLRELHAAKLRAVELENYDEAKRLKLAIERVRSTGSELARLEAQKLKAVEAEDYDQAKLIKMQMDRLREHTTFADQQSHAQAQSQVPGRGSGHGLGHAVAVSEGRVSPPLRSPSPPPPQHHHHHHQQQQQQSPSRQSQLGQYEYGRAGSQQSYYAAASHASSPSVSPTPVATFSYDERPLPALQSSGAPVEANPFGHRTGSVLSHISPLDEEATADDKSLPPIPALSESSRTAAAELLQAFGEEIVAGLYSKKIWQHRANAIEGIESQLITFYNQPGVPTGDRSASLLVLALSALGPLISDSMVNVSIRALSALQRFVEQVTPSIQAADAFTSIEPLVPALVARMDTASGRLKEKALGCMVSIMSSSALGAHCVWKHALRPLKVVSAPRPLLARMELLSELLPRSAVEDTMQRLEPLVKSLLLPALKHRNGAVRETAVQLAVLLHAQVHGSLLPLLEGLNPKLMSSLSKAFNENGGTRRHSTAPVRKEVESPPLSNSRAGNGRAAPHRNSTEQQQTFDEEDNDNDLDEDDAFDPTLCRFCGMQDESFVHEENLDLHYWRTCPMLVSCKLCEQVVEIPTLGDHLLAECEAKADVQLCPQCQEPFSSTDIQLHIRTDNCHPPAQACNRCPLCHSDIGAGEIGWRDHLLQAPGCPLNTR